MKKMTITLAVLATLIAGCASVGASKNPSRIQNPEKDALKACLAKNNGDKSKCSKEREDYLRRQEMEIMDNNG
jgi:uncharacterized protein YceK